MTNRPVAAWCKARPCHTGSLNHVMMVIKDPASAALKPALKPTTAPRLFQPQLPLMSSLIAECSVGKSSGSLYDVAMMRCNEKGAKQHAPRLLKAQFSCPSPKPARLAVGLGWQEVSYVTLLTVATIRPGLACGETVGSPALLLSATITGEQLRRLNCQRRKTTP